MEDNSSISKWKKGNLKYILIIPNYGKNDTKSLIINIYSKIDYIHKK